MWCCSLERRYSSGMVTSTAHTLCLALIKEMEGAPCLATFGKTAYKNPAYKTPVVPSLRPLSATWACAVGQKVLSIRLYFALWGPV